MRPRPFKQVNDTYGHDTGDHVLRAVAYELRRELRSFDAVYRLGGEEFVVLLPGSPPTEALAVAERLRAGLVAHPPAGLPVTLSGGIASAHGMHVSPDELLHEADQALYAAKRAGRNQIAVAASSPPEHFRDPADGPYPPPGAPTEDRRVSRR